MAGTFDLHTILALRHGWDNMTSTRFSSMFSGLPVSLVTSWYTTLKEKDIEVVSAFSPGESDFPTIVVKSTEENVDQQFLGFWGQRGSDNVEHFQMLVQEDVDIFIFTQSSELTRSLYVVVRGIMMSAHRWLISECKYDSIEYRGGGDLDPEKDLFPEAPVFSKVQRWTSTGVAGVQTVDISSSIKPFVVSAEDIPVGSGNYGGVTGSESV